MAAQKKFIQSPNPVKDPNLKGLKAQPRGGRRTTNALKDEALKLLQKGHQRADVLEYLGRTTSTWAYWRRSDPEFAKAVDRIVAMRERKNKPGSKDAVAVPDFPEFCYEYLGWELYRHQLQWFDIMEGRAPRDLHSSQMYDVGRQTHLIINTPPNHAKSTTLTVAYVLWTILKNRNALVAIVSKKQEMAADFLSQIKDFLTNPAYEKLHRDFAPDEGFEKTATEWNRTRIRFGPAAGRDESAANPTVQALGLQSQIYGTRLTLCILDDCIDTNNANEVDGQFNWLTRMVITRLGAEGRLLVVGTRVAPVDLYSELRNPERYSGEDSGWTYFAQPAVEDFGDGKPENWQTLWPRSNKPQVGDLKSEPDENGLYPMWTGPRLKALRAIIGENAWVQGYQQMDLQETAVFPRDQVYGCVHQMRMVGRLNPGAPGHPEYGMPDLRVIAGLDPASAGHTAAVAVGYCRFDQRRWLLRAHNQAGMTPDQIRNLMISWTEELGVAEWRVEKVLLSTWITQDLTITRELANRGAVIAEHITTKQTKWDVDGGILSLTTLIQGGDRDPKTNLLQLPSTQNEAVRALCEQMVTYFPKTKGKTDLLMALWFAEARIREIAQSQDGYRFMPSPFTTAQDKQFQFAVDLNAIDPQESAEVVFSPFQRRAS